MRSRTLSVSAATCFISFMSKAESADCSMARVRSSFSPLLRLKTLTSTTVPSIPGGTLRLVFFTSRALSPKMALKSFSSGVSWVSPLGVILPTRMSSGTTLAPRRIMPQSSRLRSISSETFGMSRVISSGPSLVSRATTSNSSMCTEV